MGFLDRLLGREPKRPQRNDPSTTSPTDPVSTASPIVTTPGGGEGQPPDARSDEGGLDVGGSVTEDSGGYDVGGETSSDVGGGD